MILSRDFIKKNYSTIQAKPENYMILDIEHLGFMVDEEAFEVGIQIVNIQNVLRMVNDTFEKVGVNKKIDISILGHVLNSIYSRTPFRDDQLQELVIFQNRLNEIQESFQNISPLITGSIYLPSSVIMAILGFDLVKQYECNRIKSNRFTDVTDEFYKIEDKLFAGEISVKEFRKLGVELLNKSMKVKS